MIRELLQKNRSYRRFNQDFRIDRDTLSELVGLTRLCPSGGNRQSLKYIIETDAGQCEKIFETLAWAAFLSNWKGPANGERPSAYIVILEDSMLGPANLMDVGIAAQTMLLGAVSKGLGGCMLGSIKKKELAEVLSLSERYDIKLVIALGKPGETVVLEDAEGDDIRYWRDENGVHHVPKRKLSDIVL
ncbi:MAG: nitroreductase family protein [Clostridiales bacterium]|jgi:nitroreductase|nr:nitroreductase family protein [Clostridiales bacterium]